MIGQRIPPLIELEATPCWYHRWGISPELAYRLSIVADMADPLPVTIISGFRTAEHERELQAAGPGIDPRLSTHTTCPATGADLSLPSLDTTDQVKAMFGGWVIYAGLRWGGGSTIDAAGIPRDWNHVDLGPRQDKEAVAYRTTL